MRSMGSINPNPNQGLSEGLVRSMGALTPNQGLARTNSGPFDFQGDPLRAPLSRRTSSTPTGFLGREDGPGPQSGGNSAAPPSLFTQYREQGPWLSPEDQKEMFRHEQSKMYEDRVVLERALRAQQLGRQLSGGFDGGPNEGRGGMDPEMAGRFAQAGHFRPELAGGYNQNPLDYARFPSVQQQQQQRQHAQQAQSQQHPSARPQFSEAAPGPPTPPASETVSPSPEDFQEYSPFGGQPSLFKENSGKSIW
ncbi:hypothetical protein KFL_002210010 [Klebsormidium nitens]|uniref:Uncharacterized protein n=1 Tax=Klebsormidium nitens TaxID=105231 RepID=A0A1Y1I8V2_KLENI|nr:hypothetical protein KFL_002210010 [Klebsormidium nitens]|eukprot:GAQ85137.1 hypothetical protein KFL_002210010 [Klebsormidium nitens]